MIKLNNFFIFLFSLIPIFLITGPALPDIVISTCAIYFLLIHLSIKKNFNFLKDKFFLVSIIFWITIIFVSIFANYKIKSFQDSVIFIRFLLMPTIGYYFFFSDQKKIKKVITIIFICVIFVLLDTLFQFINYDSEFGFQEDILGFKSEWYGRLTGPFGNELIPGAYLSKFGLIGYLFFFFFKKIKYKNYLEVIYLSSIGFICFASGERMAFATYFLALIFLLFFLIEKRIIIFFSITISIIMIAGSYIYHPFYNDYQVVESTHYHQGLKIEKFYDCKDDKLKTCSKIIYLQPSFFEILKNFKTSAYGEIYNVGINMFKKNPLTGVGISNYQISCLNSHEYKSLMVNYACASHPHNYYLQWLAEGGIISLVSFLILLSTILFFVWKSKNKNSIKFISFACILILFWPIMSTGSLIKNWNGVLTFYIISICICINRIKII